jgi:ubiquinone/menaquinone biosynthesis C-methylase UbiE
MEVGRRLDWIGERLLDRRIRAVLPHLRGRLLDIGCGTNRLVRTYRDGVGVDVFDLGDTDLIVEDASRLPYPDESFDTVTIVAALNHMPNRSAVLAEARRLLRPGGRIVVTMIPPGISRLWHKLRERSDTDQHERGMQEGELYGMTADELRQALEAASFRVVREERFMLGVNRLTVAEK